MDIKYCLLFLILNSVNFLFFLIKKKRKIHKVDSQNLSFS